MSSKKHAGFIDSWFSERGFGFIREIADGNIKSYFLHITKIISGVPAKGALCSFNIGVSDKGPMALDVEIEHRGLEVLRTTTREVVSQNVEVITTGGVE